MSGPVPGGHPGAAKATDRRPAALLILLFLAYAACGLAGYGNDNDTYGMLRTWAGLRQEGIYVPSRSPGFPLPELLIGAAAEAGGHVAANLLSALMACWALASFHRLLRPLGPERSLLGAAAAGANPAWVIAASSSMDYVYGAAFFLAGLASLQAARARPGGGSPPAAALAFAAAAASRLTYAPAALLAYAAFALAGPARARGGHAASAALWLGMSALAYLPSYLALGADMFRPTFAARYVDFFSLDGLPGAGAYLARFLYRNLALWGFPAALALALGAAAWLRRLRRPPAAEAASAEEPRPRTLPFLAAGAAAFAYFEAVFARLPLETAYLIPVQFLALGLAAAAFRSRALLGAVLAGHVLQNLVAFDLLDRGAGGRAGGFLESSATVVRPHLRAGDLLLDLRARPASERSGMAGYFGPGGFNAAVARPPGTSGAPPGRPTGGAPAGATGGPGGPPPSP